MRVEITHEEVIARMRRCGETVRRLRVIDGPRGDKAFWPEVVRDANEAYGYGASERMRLPPPSARAIDDMHEVFGWFVFLAGNRDETRAMWLTAGCGLKFTKASRIVGVSRETIRQRAFTAISRIVAGLNGKGGVEVKAA